MTVDKKVQSNPHDQMTILLMDKHLAPVDFINTPPKTNISMEKQPFEDISPI